MNKQRRRHHRVSAAIVDRARGNRFPCRAWGRNERGELVECSWRKGHAGEVWHSWGRIG